MVDYIYQHMATTNAVFVISLAIWTALFADDIIFLSPQPTFLQHSLDHLDGFAAIESMHINKAKSMVCAGIVQAQYEFKMWHSSKGWTQNILD